LSEAYQARIGAWDKVRDQLWISACSRAVMKEAPLAKILDDAWAEDLRYMTNQDTDSHPPRRPSGRNGVKSG